MKAFCSFALLAATALAAPAFPSASPAITNTSRVVTPDDSIPSYLYRISATENPSTERSNNASTPDATYKSPALNGKLELPVEAPGLYQSSLHSNYAAQILQVCSTLPAAAEKTTFYLASPTTTPGPELAQLPQTSTKGPGEVVIAATSTVTLRPAIIETKRPGAHTPTTVILPFHIQLWEYCTPQGDLVSAGIYTNGNIRSALNLNPGVKMRVKHFIPGYAKLEIGVYDYEKSVLRFGYAGCEWWDYET